LVVIDEANFRYLSGGVVDYSLAFISVDGFIGVISPIMEMERARSVTWADEVFGYSRFGGGGDVVQADNVFEAFKKVYGDVKRMAIPYSYISHNKFLDIAKLFGKEGVVNGDDIIYEARMVKTDYELKYLKKAVDIVDEGIRFSVERISPGVSEKDLANMVLCHMKGLGADEVYDHLIVASGTRSSLPHGRASEKEIVEGEAITMDFVASWEGYHGDETRTVFLGRPPSELIEIYEVVLGALGRVIDYVCEGVSAKDVDRVAREYIDKSGYGKYFIHSTGHGIGLEVHEKPSISSRDDTILKANMVITIEPGIYVSGLGGVRIEDDVVVTPDGCRVLTNYERDIIIL
jgi:Xaa-Pro aminopeptidase